MAEYIKREVATDAVTEVYYNTPNVNLSGAKFAAAINAIPTADVVPVVRCKDCKYNRGSKKCLNPDSFFAVPKDDDFCSYGERKDGGERNG